MKRETTIRIMRMVEEDNGDDDDDGGGEMSVCDRFYKGVDRPRRPRASVAAGALAFVYIWRGVETRPTGGKGFICCGVLCVKRSRG